MNILTTWRGFLWTKKAIMIEACLEISCLTVSDVLKTKLPAITYGE